MSSSTLIKLKSLCCSLLTKAETAILVISKIVVVVIEVARVKETAIIVLEAALAVKAVRVLLNLNQIESQKK